MLLVLPFSHDFPFILNLWLWPLLDSLLAKFFSLYVELHVLLRQIGDLTAKSLISCLYKVVSTLVQSDFFLVS